VILRFSGTLILTRFYIDFEILEFFLVYPNIFVFIYWAAVLFLSCCTCNEITLHFTIQLAIQLYRWSIIKDFLLSGNDFNGILINLIVFTWRGQFYRLTGSILNLRLGFLFIFKLQFFAIFIDIFINIWLIIVLALFIFLLRLYNFLIQLLNRRCFRILDVLSGFLLYNHVNTVFICFYHQLGFFICFYHRLRFNLVVKNELGCWLGLILDFDFV